MDEEELMDALARAARERAAKADQAERAAIDDGELDALLAPLGDDFTEAVLDDIMPVNASSNRSTLEEAVATPAHTAAPTSANTPSRWPRILAVVAAIAAVVLVLVSWPQSGTSPLPEYAFEVSGGDQELRGDPAPTPTSESRRVLSPGSKLELVARPATDAMASSLDATVFVSSGGALTVSTLDAEVAPSGAVRWRGTAGRAPLLPGVEQVVLVVHPPDADPESVRKAAVSGEGYPVRQVAVQVTP